MQDKNRFGFDAIEVGQPFVEIPKRKAFPLRMLIRITEIVMKKELLPARILLCYPKTLLASGVMESLVAHNEKSLGKRLLKLVRMQTSFAVSCPFCIDMNSFRHEQFKITEQEIYALQGKLSLSEVSTFSLREKLALEYASSASGAPLSFSVELIRQLKENFTDRDMVILASTIAQVNYWGRLIQALGVPPAGFSKECSYLYLNRYITLKSAHEPEK